MPDATAALLLLFFAAAIERAVEIVIGVVPEEGGVALRRALAVGLALAFGGGLAFGLELDLVGPLLQDASLSAAQGRAATALALAGGAAPAHELIRLIEERKTRAKQEP